MTMVFPQSMETVSEFAGAVCADADTGTMHAAIAANAMRSFRLSIHCGDIVMLKAPEGLTSCLQTVSKAGPSTPLMYVSLSDCLVVKVYAFPPIEQEALDGWGTPDRGVDPRKTVAMTRRIVNAEY
jgi:hypothetical protein